MSSCLTIKEALKCANITGQQVNITLQSGKRFDGAIVEWLCPTSCRLWINPSELCCPGGNVKKAIVALHAIKCVAFSCDAVFVDTSCRNIGECCLQGITEALNIARITCQTVRVGLNCDGCPKSIECRIISVNRCTFCMLLDQCNKKEEEKIARVEYVLFS